MDTKRMKLTQRILAMFLCVAMLLPMVVVPGHAEEITDPTAETAAPTQAPTEAAEDDAAFPEGAIGALSDAMDAMTVEAETPLAVVYAASDFQLKTGSNDDVEGGKTIMNNIIAQMKAANYTSVTGALLCGDYSNVGDTWNTSETNAVKYNDPGVTAVSTVLNNAWGLTSNLNKLPSLTSKNNAGDQVVYVQGNHDPADTIGLDSTGANDSTHYGVFVIHEDNFQWEQDGTNTGNDTDAQTEAKKIAAELKSYLQDKLDAKDSRPIFVCSHVPLHYGYRTTSAKSGDNIYAKYLFDVLNEYGKKLNIIFLFGHNHSNTYDDYLGGAAVYLPAGDKLRVPNEGSTTNSTEYTLNFTYMNAGYLGYYGGNCETQLSSSVFKIYNDHVEVARYGENSAVNLKDKGIKASTDPSSVTANETVYTNSSKAATITLKTFTASLEADSMSSGKLTPGKTGVLTVSGLYNITYDVQWSSSNDDVVSVVPSSDGMSATLSANSLGSATITAVLKETGTVSRAVGDTTTLTYNVEVTEINEVVLAEAGTHTYYVLDDNQDSSTWAADTSKRYVLVSQDKGNPTAGRFMAMYYNGKIDATEGDIAGDAEWRELNAEPITVMPLPVNGQTLYAVSTNDSSFLWNFESADMSDSYNWYLVKTAFNQSYSLMLSKGHTEENLKLYDPDNDGIRMRANSKTHGSVWRMSNRGAGLTSKRTYNSTDYYFAPYYDSIQGDISVYYTQNGDQNMGKRIYLYEETSVTLANPITAYMTDTSGAVSMGVGTDAGTGDVIYIQCGDQIVTVPVTLSMLSGDFNVNSPDTYNGLTVTYAGEPIVTDYTLVVNNSTTLLKNAGGKFRSTIYRLVEEMVGGRHYLIVDNEEVGEAHAMGANIKNITTNPTKNSNVDTASGAAASATVSAHNVLIQSFKVGDQTGLYIDSTRYSNEPDNPTDSIIEDQGNVNANIFSAEHKKAIRLIWTPSIIQTSSWPNITKFSNIYCSDTAYRFMISEYEDGRLWISGDDKPVLFWGGTTSNEEEWTYVPTGSGDHMQEGVVLRNTVDNFRLFYNIENYNSSSYMNKNFITEGDDTDYDPLRRRTWLYEQVDNIDTITARMDDLTGRVTVGCNASVHTGDYILVETFGTDGSVETVKVPVRVSMLSGTYDINSVDTYSNLTVTYQGKVITTNYTLIVEEFIPNDYPEFPHEGAVRIDKQLDTTKYSYLDTGVASIDLTVTGIPAQTGVDILFVLDTSSSMERCIHHVKQGNTCGTCGTVTEAKSRLTLLKQTLVQTLKDLQHPINGYAPDIDVAVACFNGYTPINSDIMLNLANKNSGDTYATEAGDATQVTRDRIDSSNISLNFTEVGKLTETTMQAAADGLYLNAGTNYDRGMEIAYTLLKAKQEQDALNGETRQQILVFMSDGIPYQFNYTMGTPWMIDWDNYLKGNTVTAVPADAGARSLFEEYRNANETLWMAEAIKGAPNQKYKIINPDLQDSNNKIEYINGLGATIYTVGMGMYKDQRISAEAANLVLANIASPEINGQKHFYECTEPSHFTGAFSEITTTVRSAGNAVFKDQMGKYFDLVTANKIPIINDQGEEEVVDLTGNPPTITVKSYTLYKRSEIGTTVDGEKVTETMVGSRRPMDPTILETITFNDDGTVVNSDKKSGNILNGKVIEAATFFYNTDKVNAQNITVGTKTIALEPETFYWNIGNIPEEELVLSYSVYLEGSMEGTRPKGTYDTNEFATLTYTNYLGNDCSLSVPTPKLPWQQATVGYAFYLVDRNGNPIINQSTGATGSFEQSVKITDPVYIDFLLNSAGQEVVAETITASNVIPEGYVLFDTAAQYAVHLESNGTGSYGIVKGADLPSTTYLVGIDKAPFKPVGTYTTTDYATANTVVWFAVTATVQAVPDTVVIDYGLPVDIDVLSNDTMMGVYGTLHYIGTVESFPGYTNKTQKLWQYLQGVAVTTNAAFTTESENGAYGTIAVRKIDGKTTGEVRYTLNTTNGMQMKEEETFVYAVNYTGPIGTNGYYYSTVTVIPATTIYYEDNFVTYKVKDYDTGEIITDSDLQWSTEGTTVEDATQAEDRPGEFSTEKLDANNIYGYDEAYGNMTQYSMGSASKVTVGKHTLSDGTPVNTYATAEFTFQGTGFDVVSVTSDKTGTILVKVQGTAADGTSVSKNKLVDTYYGYYYDGEKWVVDTDATYPDGENALYQIPVMQFNDLPYGKYTVTISASYKELYDHGQYEEGVGQYDFYLDAIRIYDPADDGAGNDVIEDAYVADGEGWPSYQELRNILIGAEDFDAIVEDDQIEGAIFIDNTAAPDGKTYSITDYANYGPNNELYLAPGQSVSFLLEAGKYTETVDGETKTMYGQNIAGIHLAMKSVNGATSVKIYDAGNRYNSVGTVAAQEINTATDLYYDITDLNGKIVMIYNSGNSILSITNIKTTYLENPNGTAATGFMMSRNIATLALASLNAVEEEPADPEVPEVTDPEIPEDTEPEVPEVTDPEIPEDTEPETFEPKSVKVTINKDTVKAGSKITVTVTTSDDVDHIIINGEKVTKFSGNRHKHTRTWSVRLTAEEIGEMEIVVVCCNSENEASEPIVKNVTVTGKNNSNGNGNGNKPGTGSNTGSSGNTSGSIFDFFFSFFAKWMN